MKYFTFLIVLSFSFVTYSNDPINIFMEAGIKTHENIISFIKNHSCELGADKNCNRSLSAKDLEELKRLLLNLEQWRRLAFEGFAPVTKTGIKFPQKLLLGETFSKIEKNNFHYITLNTQDKKSLNFIRNVQIGVGTTLLLYDNYFRLVQEVAKAKKLRSIIQYDLPEEGPYLSKTYALANDKSLWEQTQNALNFLDEVQSLGFPRVDKTLIFEQYIATSFTGLRMKSNDINYRMMKALLIKKTSNEGDFFEKINRIVGLFSKIFGNTTGKVQTRKGKLKHLASNKKEINNLKSSLKPLSILLEKTPMRLTDAFIPGFYGHVAIWLGTAHELEVFEVEYNGRMIPLLSHPDVLPHLEKLSNEKLIVEALREPGVTMNTLEHFLDIDDLLILDPPDLDEATKARYLLKTFQQIGKPYDFNFDILTEREIICSELIYTVFSDYTWPTSVSLGRNTINPDQVAWKAIDSCFEPVVLFHNGKKIENYKKLEIKRLLELPGGINYSPVGHCF